MSSECGFRFDTLSGRSGNSCVKSAYKFHLINGPKGQGTNVAGRKCDVHKAECSVGLCFYTSDDGIDGSR